MKLNCKDAFQAIEQDYFKKHDKTFTFLTSQPYATSKKMHDQFQIEDDIINSNPNAKEICEIIMREELSQVCKEEFLKNNALANELFNTGFSSSELSPNPLQRRLVLSSQKGKLVFFPTGVTTQLFGTILKTYRRCGFYLTCQKGVGMSFSAALLVILLRQDPSKRVLYINSAEDFCQNPVSYLVDELHKAFSEELHGHSTDLLSKLWYISDLKTDEEKRNSIGNFMSHLKVVLKKKQIEPFIIIDQVDFLEKHRNDSPVTNLAFMLYQMLRASNLCNATRVLICSDINEAERVYATQQFPAIILKPALPTDEAATRFIKKRSSGLITDEDQDKIAKIIQLTGKSLLMMDEIFCEKNEDKEDFEERLKRYEAKKMVEIIIDVKKFFETNQEIDKSLVEKRKAVMKLVLETLLRKREDHEYEVKLPQLFDKDHIDQRYFIYDIVNCTIKPITPLVISALKVVFDDFDVLEYLSWKYP